MNGTLHAGHSFSVSNGPRGAVQPAMALEICMKGSLPRLASASCASAAWKGNRNSSKAGPARDMRKAWPKAAAANPLRRTNVRARATVRHGGWIMSAALL